MLLEQNEQTSRRSRQSAVSVVGKKCIVQRSCSKEPFPGAVGEVKGSRLALAQKLDFSKLQRASTPLLPRKSAAPKAAGSRIVIRKSQLVGKASPIKLN